MKISDKQDLEILNKLNSEHIINDIAEVISKGVPYIDAVIDYADRHNLEVEVIGEIIKRSPVLKAKIYREAEELNMVEKLVRLPV
jgi:predicted aldo/keto reductase-like oxidoreductase|tara:strand:- start:1330 stop:1584 length:255 start_codon:yes stop_codon:yes gene_type:complete